MRSCIAQRVASVRTQADATYLIVNDKMELENFGLNAVCTHLGCVVPWDTVCRLCPSRFILLTSNKRSAAPPRLDVCELVWSTQLGSLAHSLLAIPQNENKFKCPCHGSQYNFQGKVVRGPAPLSLALAHMEVKDDLVTFSPWCASTSLRMAATPAFLLHHLPPLTSVESVTNSNLLHYILQVYWERCRRGWRATR